MSDLSDDAAEDEVSVWMEENRKKQRLEARQERRRRAAAHTAVTDASAASSSSSHPTTVAGDDDGDASSECDSISNAVARNEYKTRLTSIKEEERGKRITLGKAPAFKTLNEELKELDLKACTSWVCPDPIQSTARFPKHAASLDGLHSHCKLCNTEEGARARIDAGKRAKMAVANAIAAEDDKQSTSDIENVASDLLILEMAAREIELSKTEEFRTADGGARLVGSMVDLWLQVQLKTNGPFKKDGTPFPNDSSHDGGVAIFHGCKKKGYKDILMIFIKTRIDADGKRVYKVWACKGADITTDDPTENVNGTLGPKRIEPLALNTIDALDALAERIKTSTLPRVTWEHMFLDVTAQDHRKEIVLMLATRATGADVVFLFGNQTSVDCHVDVVPNQVKTYTIATGKANAGHIVKGHPARAYTANDGIECLREAAIVKSGDKYYLLYAVQPLHELLVHGIFAHDGYRGLSPSPGQSSISIPLGIFGEWLKGKECVKEVNEPSKWLEKTAFGFRRPIEIKPGEYGIPIEWLKEAAQEAADPSEFPSEVKLNDLDAEIARAERQSASAAGKRRIRYDDYDDDDDDDE